MKRGAGLIAAGFALTALSYGLARFAYGLFLPQITLDIGLGLAAAGWIGSASFCAYCVGVVAAFAGGRLGDRFLVVLASLSATAGMSPSRWMSWRSFAMETRRMIISLS